MLFPTTFRAISWIIVIIEETFWRTVWGPHPRRAQRTCDLSEVRSLMICRRVSLTLRPAHCLDVFPVVISVGCTRPGGAGSGWAVLTSLNATPSPPGPGVLAHTDQHVVQRLMRAVQVGGRDLTDQPAIAS
jgi:hypothetical protein